MTMAGDTSAPPKAWNAVVACHDHIGVPRRENITRVGVGIMKRSNENSLSIFDTDLGAIVSAGAMFTARGFSYSTIRALVVGGIDAPEHLLFATESDLLAIPGIDERAAQEIAQYRARFGAADHEPPLKASSAAPSVRADPPVRARVIMPSRRQRSDVFGNDQ